MSECLNFFFGFRPYLLNNSQQENDKTRQLYYGSGFFKNDYQFVCLFWSNKTDNFILVCCWWGWWGLLLTYGSSLITKFFEYFWTLSSSSSLAGWLAIFFLLLFDDDQKQNVMSFCLVLSFTISFPSNREKKNQY